MLCAAVATAVFRQVVIVAANARHADDLRSEFCAKADRFSHEAISPIGTISSSVSRGWFGDGPTSGPTDGERSFQDSEELAQWIRSSATFVFVTEPSAFKSWPSEPVIFVDNFAEDAFVESGLRQMGVAI